MNFKASSLVLLCLLFAFSSFSQKGKNKKPLERDADFQIIEQGNNTFKFQSQANQLEVLPTPGATKAPSFGHYWEFGDGHYSFEENPIHTYTRSPDGDAVLYLTNNYDNGELPKEKPKRPKPTMASLDGPVIDPGTYLTQDTFMLLRNNHDPKPNERMVCILSYKNPSPEPMLGKLYLFFNESVYPAAHFELVEERSHFGEVRDLNIANENLLGANPLEPTLDFMASTEMAFSLDPAIEIKTVGYSEAVNQALEEAKEKYKDVVAWDTGLMGEGEERNLFTTLATTASMLKDTTATITIKGIYVPESGGIYTESILEMSIVSAHDPNKISVSSTRANYRNIKGKEITYTVHFQNTGVGSADSITIDCTIPPGMDIETVKLQKTHLKKACPPCEMVKIQGQSCIEKKVINDKLVRFIFKGIQLPGKNDAENKKDTKGYVKYTVKPGKKIKKRTQKSRADIYFDKEKAVVTNFSATRFKPGLSIGLKGGYNRFDEKLVEGQTAIGSEDYYFWGATLSPFKSYKLYYQMELMVGRWRTDSEVVNSIFVEADTPIGLAEIRIDTIRRDWTEYFVWDAVPLQLRKNVTSFLSIGAGLQISARFKKVSHKDRIEKVDREGNAIEAPLMIPMTTTNTMDLFPAVFGDVSLGLVRAGPALGLRYHYQLNETLNNNLQFYLLWKI